MLRVVERKREEAMIVVVVQVERKFATDATRIATFWDHTQKVHLKHIYLGDPAS